MEISFTKKAQTKIAYEIACGDVASYGLQTAIRVQVVAGN